MKKILIAITLITIFLTGVAYSQYPDRIPATCVDNKALSTVLKAENWKVEKIYLELDGDNIVTLYRRLPPDKEVTTWAIVVDYPSGISCIISVGKDSFARLNDRL